MFGKIPVLKLTPKMLLYNYIEKFSDLQYQKEKLMDISDLDISDAHSKKECKWNHFFLVCHDKSGSNMPESAVTGFWVFEY